MYDGVHKQSSIELKMYQSSQVFWSGIPCPYVPLYFLGKRAVLSEEEVRNSVLWPGLYRGHQKQHQKPQCNKSHIAPFACIMRFAQDLPSFWPSCMLFRTPHIYLATSYSYRTLMYHVAILNIREIRLKFENQKLFPITIIKVARGY